MVDEVAPQLVKKEVEPEKPVAVEKKLAGIGEWFFPARMANGFVLCNNNTYHLVRFNVDEDTAFEFNGVKYLIDRDVAVPLVAWKPHGRIFGLFSTKYTAVRNSMRYIWADKEMFMVWREGEPNPITLIDAHKNTGFDVITPGLLKIIATSGLEAEAIRSMIQKMRTPIPRWVMGVAIVVAGVLIVLYGTGLIHF